MEVKIQSFMLLITPKTKNAIQQKTFEEFSHLSAIEEVNIL